MRQQHTILLVYAAKKIAQKTKLNIQAAKKGAQFDQLLFYGSMENRVGSSMNQADR